MDAVTCVGIASVAVGSSPFRDARRGAGSGLIPVGTAALPETAGRVSAVAGAIVSFTPATGTETGAGTPAIISIAAPSGGGVSSSSEWSGVDAVTCVGIASVSVGSSPFRDAGRVADSGTGTGRGTGMAACSGAGAGKVKVKDSPVASCPTPESVKKPAVDASSRMASGGL